MLKKIFVGVLCATMFCLTHVNDVDAQIDGFNFLSGWTPQFGDGGTSLSVGADFIEITNGTSQSRNIWFNTRQPVDTFTAAFRYQTEPVGALLGAPGISFIIQNDPRGTSAVTDSIVGGGFSGIDQSVGLVFDLTNVGGTSNSFSFQRNGVFESGETSLDFRSTADDGLFVTLEYDGTLLNVSIDDGDQPPLTETLFLSPSIAASLASGDALVGFGASTNSSLSSQTISEFTFTPGSTAAVPEPASGLTLAAFGCLAGLKRRRKR